jgi:hypothetical protein
MDRDGFTPSRFPLHAGDPNEERLFLESQLRWVRLRARGVIFRTSKLSAVNVLKPARGYRLGGLRHFPHPLRGLDPDRGVERVELLALVPVPPPTDVRRLREIKLGIFDPAIQRQITDAIPLADRPRGKKLSLVHWFDLYVRIVPLSRDMR